MRSLVQIQVGPLNRLPHTVVPGQMRTRRTSQDPQAKEPERPSRQAMRSRSAASASHPAGPTRENPDSVRVFAVLGVVHQIGDGRGPPRGQTCQPIAKRRDGDIVTERPAPWLRPRRGCAANATGGGHARCPRQWDRRST